jgi:phenylacetate-CoA ligase
MPLIRYNLDDVAVLTDERCGCGRSWPRIKHIIGRTREYITLLSGRRINPRSIRRVMSEEVWKNIFVIQQYQFIQESRDKILMKIVKGRDFDPDIMLRIKRRIENVCRSIHEDVDVEIIVVNCIPKDRSGKRPDIISLIERHR